MKYISSIGLLILALAASSAGGQPTSKMVRIGYLAPVFPCSGPVPSLAAFRQGLRELGYVEGQNAVIECRSAEGKTERLTALATELVDSKVDVIIAGGGELVARAAQRASLTTPIIITNAADPVRTGLVDSLARPGKNLTGLVTISPELSGKRLELLKEAFPKLSRVAVLMNPANPEQQPRVKELAAAAPAVGVQLQVVEVRNAGDFADAFAAMAKSRVDAIVPLGDPLMNSQAAQILEFAAKQRLPVIYHRAEFVEAGGLMAYGPSYNDLFRRAATYVDKIVKGARPAELPMEQPVKFELVVNMKTAKALGFTIPQSVLLRADKIVE